MTTKGMCFTRKVLRPAKGIISGNRRTIAIGFDFDDFDRISKLSQQNEVAFQEQVRRLCRAGLEKHQ